MVFQWPILATLSDAAANDGSRLSRSAMRLRGRTLVCLWAVKWRNRELGTDMDGP